MPTRYVVLTQRQADLVEHLVRNGRYENASEVLSEGLRLLEQRERQDEVKLHRLRKAAQQGFEAIDRGEFSEFADAGALSAYLSALTDELET